MKTMSLPEFPKVDPHDLPECSALLFYGAGGVTSLGAALYKHPYRPAAFHQAFHIHDGIIVNVNWTTFIQHIDDFLKSKYRIDVIRYREMTSMQKQQAEYTALQRAAGKGRKMRFYDWRGYASFGFRKIPALRHLVKPSKKWDFCSDQGVDIYESLRPPIKISEYDDEMSAPWHTLEYALKYPDLCEIKTCWVGSKFKK